MKKLKKYIKVGIVFVISIFLSILPKDKKKVLFIADTRLELGGNLKMMYDYIPNSYEKVVLLKEDRRVKRTLKEEFNLLWQFSTSKYIFLEDLVQSMSYFHFSKRQEIIQLWHGPGAFKKFGYSRLEKNGGDIKRVHRGYKKYTKAIVSSEEIRKNYAEAFGISIDKVYATGFLRTDLFFNEKYKNNKKKELLKKYPEFKNKKIILFAPTYRGAPYKNIEQGGAYYDFEKLDWDQLYKELKKDYIVLFKWHPALYNNIVKGQIEVPDFSKYKDFYYDLSDYRDINELLLITDVLITDYSSVIFDYVLLNKPIIYFAYDLDKYKNSRGFYYNFEDYVYGEIALNKKELLKSIKKENLMNPARKKFLNQFMSACDGKSTEKTYRCVFEENRKKR